MPKAASQKRSTKAGIEWRLKDLYGEMAVIKKGSEGLHVLSWGNTTRYCGPSPYPEDRGSHLDTVMRRSIVNKLPVEMRCYTSTVWALTLNNDVSTTMVDYIVIPEDKVGATPDIVKSQVMKYAKDNWDVKFFKPQTSVSQ